MKHISIIVLLLILIAPFANCQNYEYGQYEAVAGNWDIDTDTILAMSMPKISYNIDCEDSYTAYFRINIYLINEDTIDSFSVENVQFLMLRNDRTRKMSQILTNDSVTRELSQPESCLDEEDLQKIQAFFHHKITNCRFYSSEKYRKDIREQGLSIIIAERLYGKNEL
jgi:hypothetical protein